MQERRLILVFASILAGVGALMVHSASMTSRPTEAEQVFLSRHLTFLALGVLGALVASRMPVETLIRWTPPLFWSSLALLVLVLLPGVGTRVNGAQRWFRYGALSFQPAELMKLTLPLYVCCLSARRHTVTARSPTVREALAVAFPIALVVPLVMLQPDLGTALFLAAGGAIALWISGWPLRFFVVAGALFVPAVGLAVWHRPYQVQRIVDFSRTWADWTQAPYHLKQSLVTLGAGGTLGAGLGKGFQKLSFLPEANSDFVFAVIGEELGLVGSLAVMALWLAIYAAGLRLISRLKAGTFRAAAAFTLLTQLFLQSTLNIAVVTAMAPPKGIPHPLLSYGGSSLLVSLLSLGLLLSLTADGANERTAQQGSGSPGIETGGAGGG